MVKFPEIKNKTAPVCVVGLGYVGLPLAVYLARHFSVIGFDIDADRISELESGVDRIKEVNVEDLRNSTIRYTSDPADIAVAKFFIVAVPTPVDEYNVPDLSLVEKATATVGRAIRPGAVVVYESTVYPGVTEDICVPILEKMSGLRFGVDFSVGYSPERVNPGDKTHTISAVTKVVSGSDDETVELLAGVYGAITTVYRAQSIKVAEAAKVIENTQRDLNIALVNELAIIFNKMGLSVYDVLAAAKTKWNFLPFEPGLVGGHCIGVDPYYLTYKAEQLGHHSEVVLAGRRMNDAMHKFIAHQILKLMVQSGKDVRSSRVVFYGITFKENVPDVRNSKVALLFKELASFGLEPFVYDPHADPAAVWREYGIRLTKKEDLPKADTLIVAVSHDEFKRLTSAEIRARMNHEDLLLVDVKHIYKKDDIEKEGIAYWSL